ncbi:class F sortase [Streptomyces sp. NPDC005805]|uniref:class F sortase n=1 Tax=Streptomyces sp. NPDC005805 TaxID=3157068 RepID=UPI0033F9D1BA
MDSQQSSGQHQQSHSAPRSFGRAMLWPVIASVLGVLLIYNSFDTTDDAKPPSQPAAVASASPSAAPTAAPSPSKAAPKYLAAPRSVPERLKIMEIAVDAPFMGLSIGEEGRLDAPPPDDRNLVGWFQEGVTPGELGTSIVAGHVDTKTGPAVFLQLRMLKKGSKVDILREDGSTVTFVVDSVENFEKDDFPNDRVYADTPDAQLRLITCGGEYDRKAKDYTENVVVFAHLDSVTSP